MQMLQLNFSFQSLVDQYLLDIKTASGNLQFRISLYAASTDRRATYTVERRELYRITVRSGHIDADEEIYCLDASLDAGGQLFDDIELAKEDLGMKIARVLGIQISM